MKVKA